MKTVAIIQARMESTRLPGKMMMDLGDEPVIAWSLQRVRLATMVNEVWLATTTNSSDDIVAAWAIDHGFPVYRGSVTDVLDRYYQTAKLAKADTIVRLTGDCPFLDPVVIDAVVAAFYEQKKCAYVSNIQPPTFPDGLDAEVFSMTALEKAWQEAKLKSEREHVTPYIWKNPDLFPNFTVKNSIDLSAERWTLDTAKDLEFLQTVVKNFGKQIKFAPYQEILTLINTHPEWKNINGYFKRNEGYQKSLQDDVSSHI